MNGARDVTSAEVTNERCSSHTVPPGVWTGANALGSVIAATAVVTGFWSAAMCGLKPDPTESVAM